MSEFHADPCLGAALRALPLLEPPQSQWPRLAQTLRPRRSARRWPWLAAAAAIALATILLPRQVRQPDAMLPVAADTQDLTVQPLMQQSAQLESMLDALGPAAGDRGSDIALRDELSARLQRVDVLLGAESLDPDARWLLWRQRVALMQQLVDVATDAPWLAALTETPGAVPVAL